MTFERGARVLLRSCRHGEPGIVRGELRGRILVEWRDLGIEGRHRAERLELVQSVPERDNSEHANSP